MKTKVIIIGAGPIGLYVASKCDDFLLLEATSSIGGQLTNLYPEKLIVDIPNHEPIKAKDYIKELESTVNLTKIKFNEKVINVIEGDEIKVITNDNEYICDYLIIATGLGFSTPRKLGIPNDDCENILYSLKDFSFLKNKKVAIFGGGDSALDWSKEISAISDNVSLVHRREEFRGNPETIANCHNLKKYLPYVPFEIKKENNIAKAITIKNVKTEQLENINVDYILVNYGNIAEQNKFSFKLNGSFIKVDENYSCSKNIFVIGDQADYENKKRRIANGIDEANHVLNIIG